MQTVGKCEVLNRMSVSNIIQFIVGESLKLIPIFIWSLTVRTEV